MKSNRSTMAPKAISSRVPRSSSTAEASRFEVARLSGKTPPCNLTSQLGSLPPKESCVRVVEVRVNVVTGHMIPECPLELRDLLTDVGGRGQGVYRTRLNVHLVRLQ
uniref:(northern house mosquito) hypothetical protein n=1 Tax=Culex pipiens TaxID=7175 RepID=A0A8D8DNC4_CULPI